MPELSHQRLWRIVHSEASRGWGGQEHRILAELTGFQKRGSKVWLLAPHDAHVRARAEAAGISTAPLYVAKWRYPFEVLRLACWLRRIRPDVLNTHSSRDGWLVGMAGRLARVPLQIRSRHFDVSVPNPRLSRHVYVTLADHIITTSSKVVADFCTLFRLPERRVSAIPTGVDMAKFSPEGSKVSFAFPSEITGPLVGIIGVIRHAKGHAVLFEGIKQLGEQGFPVRCVVVGDSPNRAGLERRVSELGLSGRVLFVGQREDVPAILRSLDVLAIPSLHEAIPQVGLQALACEVPVIGSDVGGIPQIIRPKETGRLFSSGNATALAAAIRETFAQADETRRMALAGRHLVVQHHSLEGMVDTIEGVYRRHLG